MFQGGRNCLGRARFSLYVLLPSLRERVRLMNAPRFKIGDSVVYRIRRVNQGRFLIMAMTARPARDKISYRIRSQDDGNIERLVDESALSTS
jgi:hypothetical protein